MLRVLTLRSSWAVLDGDEAFGPVMALRAAHGHLSLLFWGGNYGGAGITWLEAPLVAVFGLHLWIFQAVDTALTLVAVLLVRGIGRRITTPLAADVAAGTFWFFPALWVYWSEREYVFWLPAIVFALAAGVLTLRWFETRRDATLLWVGLCAGLAIWSYPLVASLVVPPVAVLLWTVRRSWSALARVVGAGLVGLLPWIAFFVIHGSSAFTEQASTESRRSALVHAITQTLPTALVGGVKPLLTVPSPSVLTALGVTVYVGTVAFTVYAAATRQVALATCGCAVVFWPFVVALGHVPVEDVTYRYGLVVIAPLLLIAAHLLAKLRVAPLLAVAAFTLVVVTASTDTSSFAAVPACDPTFAVVARHLGEQDRTSVWASYWITAPLEVCSGGALTISSVTTVRDEAAAAAAATAPRSTYVVYPGNPLDGQISAWVTAHHAAARRTIVGGWAVWEFTDRASPREMGLTGEF